MKTTLFGGLCVLTSALMGAACTPALAQSLSEALPPAHTMPAPLVLGMNDYFSTSWSGDFLLADAGPAPASATGRTAKRPLRAQKASVFSLISRL